MARDDDMESRHRRINIECRQVVQYIDGDGIEFDRHRGLQAGRPGAMIVIAAHRLEAGDFPQTAQHRGAANITRMQDVIDAAQGGDSLRPQQIVGVGDNAYFHSCARLE